MLCCLFWFVRAAGRKCVFYCFAFSSLFSHSVATWRFAFRFTFYLSGTGWGTKQIYLRASEEMPLAKGRTAPTVRCEIDCKVWPFHHYNYFTNTNKYIHMYAMQRCKCISLFFICFLLARFACSCCYFSCLHWWRFTLHVRLGWGGTLYASLLTFFLWHGVMCVRERWGRLLHKNGLFLHRKSKWNSSESSKALISYNHKWKTTWTVSLAISGTQTHTHTWIGWKNQCTCVRKYVHVCVCAYV